MSDVIAELSAVIESRNDIKLAIENKGQNVNTDIRTYANAIENISANSVMKLPDGTKFAQSTFTTFPNFDTSEMVDMSNMFYGCLNLTTVPNLDTSNVINMARMFYDCYNLTTVPNLDTSNVINMANMFYGCLNLTTVPNFNTSNVIRTVRMFYDCYNLTTVPNLDTSNVTDMAIAFQNCYNLVDVPQLNTSNITNMRQTFCNCNNLSNESIQNIINMCLNSNITASSDKTLLTSSWNSPFAMSTINNSYYQNRWAELDAAGWTY